MKNKIILVGIMFLITITGVINVNAESEAAWPKTFTYQEYEYTIEGFELRVYQLDARKKVTTKTEKDGITIEKTTSEDMENYFQNNPTKVINLSPTEYTINPEYKEDKLNGSNAIFINLKLNMNKEKLEVLLQEEMAQVTKDISYIGEVVVKYKLTKAPVDYQYFQNINTIKELLRLIAGDTDDNSHRLTGLNVSNSQVIGATNLSLNEDGVKKFEYDRVLSDKTDNTGFGLNYLVLDTSESITDENSSDRQLFMFHDFDNIEYLIQNYQKIEDGAGENIKENITNEQDNAQVVKVDNTGAKLSKCVYIIGILSIILGTIIIVLVINKRKSKIHEI